ncbi:hypothetical protein AAG570_003380 [Ranatra chinensis]|uniref:WSC domain-containing protein n=1 Tax=Ranatra chinensis TaxID=642074 RepID=A0ABD0YHX9_9HEMI
MARVRDSEVEPVATCVGDLNVTDKNGNLSKPVRNDLRAKNWRRGDAPACWTPSLPSNLTAGHSAVTTATANIYLELLYLSSYNAYLTPGRRARVCSRRRDRLDDIDGVWSLPEQVTGPTSLRCARRVQGVDGCRGVVRPHHAGCFRDEHGGNNMRQVAPSGIRYVTSDQNMTGPVCSYICFNKGFMFATVRRYQCKCTDVPANLPTEFQKCDVPCLGDPEQMCGGKPNLSTGYYTSASGKMRLCLTTQYIYRHQIDSSSEELEKMPNIRIDEPPEGKDVACLEDTGDFRVIPEHRLELKLTNTPARCIGICLRLGYTYAGLRNSYECFCGTLRKQAPAAGGCDMPCPINKSSNCGGAGRIMVYRTTTEGGFTSVVCEMSSQQASASPLLGPFAPPTADERGPSGQLAHFAPPRSIAETCGPEVMSRQRVYEWAGSFKKG